MRDCRTPSRPVLKLIVRSEADSPSSWDIFLWAHTNLFAATTLTCLVPTARPSHQILTMLKGCSIRAALSLRAAEHRFLDHWAWDRFSIGSDPQARFPPLLLRRILCFPSTQAGWNSVCPVQSVLRRRSAAAFSTTTTTWPTPSTMA